MTDNDIFIHVKSLLDANFPVAGFTNVKTKQGNPSRSQGANTAPTVYMIKVADYRYGTPTKRDVATGTGGFDHFEYQQYESTFQLSALVDQVPGTPNPVSAADLLNLASGIIASDVSIRLLSARGAGVLKISDVRNPVVEDDRGENAAEPSFDFVITHKRGYKVATPAISTYESGIYRV